MRTVVLFVTGGLGLLLVACAGFFAVHLRNARVAMTLGLLAVVQGVLFWQAASVQTYLAGHIDVVAVANACVAVVVFRALLDELRGRD